MKNFIKISVPILIFLFLTWRIGQNWQLIEDRVFSVNFPLFILALVVLVMTHVGGSFFWHKILLILSLKIPFKESFRIFVISNFGRFIPGVILHYAARVYLGKKIGLGVKEGILSVFLEAYYTFAGGVIVSILALPILSNFISLIWLLPISLTLIFLILVLPPRTIFDLASKIPILGKKIPIAGFQVKYWEHYFLIGISAGLFLLNGMAFFLLASTFIENPFSRIFTLTGLFSSAWLVGFLTPVAPGGLGVTDLSFAYLLTTYYNFPLASFLAVAYRFGLLVTEGVVFLFVIKLFGFNLVGKKI